MYGTQTIQMQSMTAVQFENDVKMYGTQTQDSVEEDILCLRMM